MKITNLRVILFNMTKLLKDFVKGTKGIEKEIETINAKSSKRIADARRESCQYESQMEAPKTIESSENLTTSLAPQGHYSDNFGIKQQADVRNRTFTLLKCQHYWEETGYEADYSLITTMNW